MATKSEQVLIRITPDTKDEWQSALDESRFTSLAEYIRFAVNNEIDGRHETSEPSTEAFADVLSDTTEDLDEHHQSVMERLEGIEAAINGVQEDMGGIVEVAEDEIIEVLPVIDRSDIEIDIESEHPDNASKTYAMAKSAEDVAQELGYPVEPVERTLEQLAMKSERVKFSRGTRGKERRFHLDV